MWWCFLCKKSSPIPALIFFHIKLDLFFVRCPLIWRLETLEVAELSWFTLDFGWNRCVLASPCAKDTNFFWGERIHVDQRDEGFSPISFALSSGSSHHLSMVLSVGCCEDTAWSGFFAHNHPHLVCFWCFVYWNHKRKIILKYFQEFPNKGCLHPFYWEKTIVRPFWGLNFWKAKSLGSRRLTPPRLIYGETMVGRLTTRNNG